MFRVHINIGLLTVLALGLALTVGSEPAAAATGCWKTDFKKCCDINTIPNREILCGEGPEKWTCVVNIVADPNVRLAVKSPIGWSQKTDKTDANLKCRYKSVKCGQNQGDCVYGDESSSTCDDESWGSGSVDCDTRKLSVGCDPNDIACLMAAAEGCPTVEEPPCDPAMGCEEPPGGEQPPGSEQPPGGEVPPGT